MVGDRIWVVSWVGDIRLVSGQIGLDVTGGMGTRVIKLWENVCKEKTSDGSC